MAGQHRTGGIGVFALATFLSSFLLFQIQPLIGRYILPWYGGSPAVWTTCMLFFQVLLLAGYSYAHLLTVRLRPRVQYFVHLGLVAISLAVLPITPHERWKAVAGGDPTLRILLLLTLAVGLPYLVASATAPLVQRWFSLVRPGKSPYRLYAISNAGSLLGLLTYPFLVEPLMGLRGQTLMWSVGYAGFAVTIAAAGWPMLRHVAPAAGAEARPSLRAAANWRTAALWVLLPACGSLMLLAVTNQVSQDVAVVPFLWVLPLSLYLISFIIVFDDDRWYKRRLWLPFLFVTVAAMMLVLEDSPSRGVLLQIVVFMAALFACCMVCHGELVRLRPGTEGLTAFYALVSLGGALGGVFASVIAPRIFDGYWELHLGLLGTFTLAAYCVLRRDGSAATALQRWAIGLAWLTALPIANGLLLTILNHYDEAIALDRNFYGILSVTEVRHDEANRVRKLYHGNTRHGEQFVQEDRRRWATSYYSTGSGIGITMAYHPARDTDRGVLNTGVIGLGAGTIATLAEKGDRARFYEIDPTVEQFAREYFTFLEDSQAEVEVVIGDARISLERELREQGSGRFDVLVLDAFSSDAIPIHLVTREAMQLYWKHLEPDGILAAHITNRHLDLSPVLRALAAEAGKSAILIEEEADRSRRISGSTWVLMTDNEAFLSDPRVKAKQSDFSKDESVVWTDDYSNLLDVLD